VIDKGALDDETILVQATAVDFIREVLLNLGQGPCEMFNQGCMLIPNQPVEHDSSLPLCMQELRKHKQSITFQPTTDKKLA
jgi:hypothetical protein